MESPFPYPDEVEAAPPAPRTEVAVAAAGALDLKKLNLTDVALAQFGDWRTALAEAEKRLQGVAWDVSTTKGLNDIKSVRQRESKDPRAEANKIADALASKLTTVGKEVRGEQKLIVAAWDKLAEPLTKIIDDREAVLAEEARKAEEARAEAALIEAQKAAAHATRLGVIGGYVNRCRVLDMTAERIQAGMEKLADVDMADEVPARADELKAARVTALESMKALHAQAVAREAAEAAAKIEAARVEEQRQANAREAARLAEMAAEVARAAAELAAREAAQRAAEEAAAQTVRDAEAAAEAQRLQAVRDAEEAARLAALPPPAPAPEPEQSRVEVAPAVASAAPQAPEAAPQPRYSATAPEPADSLQALAKEARASKLPSQPKMGAEWWARFYALADAVQTA